MIAFHTCAGVCPTADLYRTVDSGASWGKLSVPEGSPIRFSSPTTGWTYASTLGNDHGRLLVSRDGGRSWHGQIVPMPRGYEGWQRGWRLPTFINSQEGVLPAELLSRDAFVLVLYVTHDGGWTWEAYRRPRGSTSYELPETAGAIDEHVAFATYPDGRTLLTRDGGHTWGLGSGGGLRELRDVSFVSPRVGWASLPQSEEQCGIIDGIFPNGPPASNCRQYFLLVRTTDSGRTWNEVQLTLAGA